MGGEGWGMEWGGSGWWGVEAPLLEEVNCTQWTVGFRANSPPRHTQLAFDEPLDVKLHLDHFVGDALA